MNYMFLRYRRIICELMLIRNDKQHYCKCNIQILKTKHLFFKFTKKTKNVNDIKHIQQNIESTQANK